MTLFAEPQLAAGSPVGLGAAMAGGRSSRSTTERRGNDYYPTPPAVTRALLMRERVAIEAARAGGPVWEPCGRGGAIAAECHTIGLPTIATDIVADPAHDVVQADLLLTRHAMAMAVVTNPPFALAERMIRHLMGELDVPYVALLLKSTFWHAASRTPLWRQHRPSRIYALNWRPDFLFGGTGAPTMEVIWCVWDRAQPARTVHSGDVVFDVLGPAPAGDLFERPG